MGNPMDAQASPCPGPALSPGGRRPRPCGMAASPARRGRLRLGQRWSAGGLFCRRPPAGTQVLPKPIDWRCEPCRPLRRRPWRWHIRHGRTTPSGRGTRGTRLRVAGRWPNDACKRASKCIGLDGRRKGSNKGTPTAPPTATRRPPGPTTWNGARPSCFAPRATAVISKTPGVMPGWPPTNRGWAKPRRSTINTTRL